MSRIRLADAATLILSSVYHSIAPDEVADDCPDVGRVLTTDEPIDPDDLESLDGHLLISLNQVIDNYRFMDILKSDASSSVYKAQLVDSPGEFVAVKIDGKFSVPESDWTISLGDEPEHRGKAHLLAVQESMVISDHNTTILSLFSSPVANSLSHQLSIPCHLHAIRRIVIQLLDLLAFFHRCGICDADINSDTVCYSDSAMTTVKFVQFSTPSQFPSYRSPESLLELQYDSVSDVWSVGCLAVELYLGYLPFDADSDSDQLHSIVALCGQFDQDIIPLSPVWWKFFDAGLRGFETKSDPVQVFLSNRRFASKFRDFSNIDLATIIRAHKPVKSDKERLLLESFVDLLSRMLTVDPDRRILAEQAESHPFVTGMPWDEGWTPPAHDRPVSLKSRLEVVAERSAPIVSVSIPLVSAHMNDAEFLEMF
jgi:serine/threonine protein kinase